MNRAALDTTQLAQPSAGGVEDASHDPTLEAVHPVGETPPPPRRHRPVGHVVGHAIGECPPPPRGNRPLGHVLGRATRTS